MRIFLFMYAFIQMLWYMNEHISAQNNKKPETMCTIQSRIICIDFLICSISVVNFWSPGHMKTLFCTMPQRMNLTLRGPNIPAGYLYICYVPISQKKMHLFWYKKRQKSICEKEHLSLEFSLSCRFSLSWFWFGFQYLGTMLKV